MRYLFIFLSVLLLTSCGSYRLQVRQPEITHVLAITKEGDTLKFIYDGTRWRLSGISLVYH